MTTDQPEDEGDLFEQPADPFEPEAPAHLDPDTEDIVHADDPDPEVLVIDDGPRGAV
ncbi:MAG TPA: hypothetical protein VLK03_06305 [Nocardioides sp.]|nr:hypothetical protein [Nocardioides sp.]